jgi:hypothetical protein
MTTFLATWLRRMAVVIGLIPVILVSGQAAAQQACAPRDTIVSQIDQLYQEKQEAIGLATSGMLVEVFVSPEGTWTILLSSPQGMSCIAAVGEGWERKPQAVGSGT